MSIRRRLTGLLILCSTIMGLSLTHADATYGIPTGNRLLAQAPPAAESTRITTFLPSVSKNELPEWTQEAGNAQRTGYIPIEPAEPWTLAWTWNGPDANGGTGGHTYDAPREARTVAGGGNIYVPAGAQGLYALRQASGQVAWHLTVAAFNATPAFDPATRTVIAGGADGRLYRIESESGEVEGTYSAGNPLNRAILLAGTFAYVVADNGQLFKVNVQTMTRAWTYSAGSNAGTGLAYSATRDVILFGTADLYVHAVNNADGTVRWHTKPSPNPAGFPNEYRWYWPVVADQRGVVFVRMRLDHNTGLWGYPSTGHVWPNTNAEARTFLQNNPGQQNLFALNLDDGKPAFVPAVGYGGVEGMIGDSPYLETGPLPVIRTVGDRQVAYIPFRNGQSQPPDGRWDGHMGEMVLDATTISGYQAGDLRFVRMSRYNGYGGSSYVYVSDEWTPITMAGDTLFKSHWGAIESVRITDRSSSKGLTYANPIATVNHPTIIREQTTCANKNTTTHWTTCGLTLYRDGRFWDGPGWWIYWNAGDVTSSSGVRPRYTYVTGGLIVVESDLGEILVFHHSV